MKKDAVLALLVTDRHRGFAHEVYVELCELTHQMEQKLIMKRGEPSYYDPGYLPLPMKDKLNQDEIEALWKILHKIDTQLAQLSETISGWYDGTFEALGME